MGSTPFGGTKFLTICYTKCMTKQNSRVTLDISWSALFKILAVVGGLFAAYLLREVLIMLFVVFIFVAAVNPTIKTLQKYMSRSLAVTFFYVMLLLAISLIGYLFLPRFIEQMEVLAKAFPAFIDRIRPLVEGFQTGQGTNLVDQVLNSVSSALNSFGGDAFSGIAHFFNSLLLALIGTVISFYLLLEEKNAREFLHQILPRKQYPAIYQTLRKISTQLGAWIRGQLVVMLFVALLNAIVYTIIGIPSPLPLGIWAGLGELIPYLGPYIGVLPGFALAIASGNILQVILVAVINYFAIQQFQAFYITPRVMSKAVGLSPVLVIIAIVVGINLFGIFGALVALPCAAIVSVLVDEWANLRQLWERPSEVEIP